MAGLNELKGTITHRRIPILYYKPGLDTVNHELEKLLYS